MTIPNNPWEFYTHPIVLLTFGIGAVIVILGICAIKVPKSRRYLKPFFKIYYVLAMAPLYAVAGLLYLFSIGELNLFRKFKDNNFQEKFKNIYLEPTKTFEDMRLNPQKYRLWIAIFICVVLSFVLQYIAIGVAEKFYSGQESIIFGVISSEPPQVVDPLQRWLMVSITGIFVWIPTKFTIHFLALKFHKYNNSDEPKNRPWYDKVRLIYISWGYIIAADTVWALGLGISLIFSTWEGLIFAWVFVIICGIMEQFLQFYSLRGLYKMGWFKAILIWIISMIPAALMILFLHWWLGPLIVNTIA
ncbi:MAG: hypothetical protein HWN65_08955 [Candidatus Helarchaeota archaeon]|nr:hypothetical protein [Candidatus Helarchaeota archaeon]